MKVKLRLSKVTVFSVAKKLIKIDPEGDKVQDHEELICHGVSDIQAYFKKSDKKTLLAVNFFYAGLSFVIDEDFSVLIEDEDSKGKAYLVSDPKILESIDKYLEARSSWLDAQLDWEKSKRLVII